MPRTFFRLLLILLSISLLPQVCFSKVRLVAVGIGDYPPPNNKLRATTNDARAIQQLVSKNSGGQTSLLLDSRATKAAILSEIHSLFDNAASDDIIIFFFSGHGFQGGFVAYDGELSYSKIREAMKGSKSKNKMIFADTCFAGNMRQGRKKVKAENVDSNVMLFLSSRDTEKSIERRDMENGIFTQCLKDGLSGKADENRDRTITAKEIFNYVSKNVKLLSGNRQHPVMWGNFSNDMPVMSW